MGKIAIPAQAAGFVSLMGQIEKDGTGTLALPEAMANIGGNGQGYTLASQSGWDPTANDDGTAGSLALGDDVYIYAVQDSSGEAQWIASKNSTVPDGYTADTSRKIGGFHYGRIRGTANRYDTAYTPVVEIVPNSCWDLQHRPKCDPTGMVEVIPDQLWADIYLNSEGAGTWPDITPVSQYNATPLSGTEGYSRFLDYPYLLANAGKRFPSLAEWYRLADGSPQGNDGNNDLAWSDTSNSDRTATGTVAKAISSLNVVDCAGNLWEPTSDLYDEGGSYAWDSTILDNGKDSSKERGELRHARWRFFMAGGHWSEGVHAGARCANSSYHPEDVDSNTGVRGVCDAL